MSFEVVTRQWNDALMAAAKPGTYLRIVCPFIQVGPVRRLLEAVGQASVDVITRFDLEAFARRVSDLDALDLLIRHGARVRGVRGVHAKLYLFGDGHVIGTSANLTNAGLSRNAEFGFRSDDASAVGGARTYWDSLWSAAGSDLELAQLDQWRAPVVSAQAGGGRGPDLPDYGVALPAAGAPGGDGERFRLDEPREQPSPFDHTRPAFIKFFGEGHERARRTWPTIDAVKSAGCHYACTYPKHPWQQRPGDVLYMAHMVGDEDDIMIHGRALAVRQHDRTLDIASASERAVRPWKEKWPYYVRVHEAEFLRGTIGDGISLNQMFAQLGHSGFEPTRRNHASGKGNTNPRMSVRQQPGIQLATAGAEWLHDRFEHEIRRRGLLDRRDIAALPMD
jgi:hypothetical protein